MSLSLLSELLFIAEARLNPQQVQQLTPKIINAIISDNSVPVQIRQTAERAKETGDAEQLFNIATSVVQELGAADPTEQKLNISWIVKTYVNQNWRWEDIEAINANITEFTRVQRHPDLEIKNLDQYKTRADLLTALAPFENVEVVSGKQKQKQAKNEIYDQTKLVYRDKDVVILTPTTQEAACFFGKGTKWCTAATSSRNYFDYYNKQGPLFIIMFSNGRKYQFHFESKQYMDEMDNQIPNLKLWAKEHPVAAEKLRPQAIAFGEMNLLITPMKPEEFAPAFSALMSNFKAQATERHITSSQTRDNTSKLTKLIKSIGRDHITDDIAKQIIWAVNKGIVDEDILSLVPETHRGSFNPTERLKTKPELLKNFNDDQITPEVISGFTEGFIDKYTQPNEWAWSDNHPSKSFNNFFSLVQDLTPTNQKKLLSGVEKQLGRVLAWRSDAFPTPYDLPAEYFTDRAFIDKLFMKSSDEYSNQVRGTSINPFLVVMEEATPENRQTPAYQYAVDYLLKHPNIVQNSAQNKTLNVSQFNNLPEQLQTEELAHILISNNPRIVFDHFKDEPAGKLLDKKFALTTAGLSLVLEKHPNGLQQTWRGTPKEGKTQELNPNYSKVSKEVVHELLQKYPIAISFVPWKDQTPELIQRYINHIGTVENIPDNDSKSRMLSFVNPKMITPEMGAEAVMTNIFNALDLPSKIQKTPEVQRTLLRSYVTLCKNLDTAYHLYGDARHTWTLATVAKAVDAKIFTPSVAEKFANAMAPTQRLNSFLTNMSLKGLPPESVLIFVEKDPIFVKKITKTLLNQLIDTDIEVAKKLLGRNGTLIKKIDPNNITRELALISVANNRKAYDYLPDRLKRDDTLYRMANIRARITRMRTAGDDAASYVRENLVPEYSSTTIKILTETKHISR